MTSENPYESPQGSEAGRASRQERVRIWRRITVGGGLALFVCTVGLASVGGLHWRRIGTTGVGLFGERPFAAIMNVLIACVWIALAIFGAGFIGWFITTRRRPK